MGSIDSRDYSARQRAMRIEAAVPLSFRLADWRKNGQQVTDYPGLTRDIGRLFMGIDLQCAQCHDHLFIKDYKQVDFQGLYTVFSKTSIQKRGPAFPCNRRETVRDEIRVCFGLRHERSKRPDCVEKVPVSRTNWLCPYPQAGAAIGSDPRIHWPLRTIVCSSKTRSIDSGF